MAATINRYFNSGVSRFQAWEQFFSVKLVNKVLKRYEICRNSHKFWQQIAGIHANTETPLPETWQIG